MSRITAFLASLCALAIIATACGGSGSKSSNAKAKINPDAVLVYAQALDGSGFSQNLQPALMRNICDVMVGSQVFASLIRLDTRTNVLKPSLAESWTVVDPKTVRLKLRAGLTFQDGTPLNAAAAKAGLDQNRTAPSVLAPTMASIASVTAESDRDLRIDLSTTSAALLPYTLAGREGEIAAASSTNVKPVGAGPFKFVSQQVGTQIVLTKYDGYWDAANVKLGGIKYVNSQSAQAMNALLGGDVDMMWGTPDVNVPAENNPATAIASAPSASYYKINAILTTPPWNNPMFRQAVNYAIDRKAILDAVFKGQGQVASQPYPDTFKDQYQADLASQYKYDPKKATSLLQQAGITTPVQVKAMFPTGLVEYQRIAEIIQSELKQVGIELTLTGTGNAREDFYVQKKGSAFFTLWPARPDPSIAIKQQFGTGGAQNNGGYSNAQLDATVAKVESATDAAVQKAAYKDLVHQVMDAALDFPIAFADVSFPHRSYVVSDDWQIYGPCSGLDFSRVAITTAK